HFEAERAAGNVAPAEGAAQQPTAEQREIAALKARIDARDQRDAQQTAVREIADAVKRYPVLATNRGLYDELITTADLLHQKYPGKGMEMALASKGAVYEAIALAQAKPAAPPAAVLETPPVPALLGSAGAAPG